MSDICLDNEIIESLRKSSVHKKNPEDKERRRIFVVRRSESKKEFTKEKDLNISVNSNESCKIKQHIPRGEMSCGDHAPPQPPPTPPLPVKFTKTCQLNITEPIICSITNETNDCFANDLDHNNCNTCEMPAPSLPHLSPKQSKQSYKEKCPKLNVKKTSKISLPASASNCRSLDISRCPCGCSGKLNIARKILGPYPDEVGLSMFDRIACLYQQLKLRHNLRQKCCPDLPIKECSCHKIF